MNNIILHRVLTFRFPSLTKLASALLTIVFISNAALALPDDSTQGISLSAESAHLPDQGLLIYYGTPDNPVILIQGSLKIIALELTAEMVDGKLRSVNAIGEPAKFQQQPELDQAIIYGSANTVNFNTKEQFLSMEGAAEFIRNNESTTAFHIDYNFMTKTYNASSADNGQIRTIIMPKAN